MSPASRPAECQKGGRADEIQPTLVSVDAASEPYFAATGWAGDSRHSETPNLGDEPVKQASEGATIDELLESARKWMPATRRIALRMLGSTARADDACQLVLIRVFKSAGSYDPKQPFGSWFRRIAVNVCIDELRQSKRAAEVMEEARHLRIAQAPPGDRDEANQARERAEEVRTAVTALPPDERAVVVLRHYEQLRFTEIARILEAPESTIKTRMTRAFDRLRSALAVE